LGCRKGVDLWQEKDGVIKHVDLFATAEAGAVYECRTPNIRDFIELNQNGILISKPEYKQFFEKQSFWWEDILNLAHEVFKGDSSAVNGGTVDERVHHLPNETIESTLINMAEEAGVPVDKEEYPDLIKFRKIG
jgi:phage pi2 protein 07